MSDSDIYETELKVGLEIQKHIWRRIDNLNKQRKPNKCKILGENKRTKLKIIGKTNRGKNILKWTNKNELMRAEGFRANKALVQYISQKNATLMVMDIYVIDVTYGAIYYYGHILWQMWHVEPYNVTDIYETYGAIYCYRHICDIWSDILLWTYMWQMEPYIVIEIYVTDVTYGAIYICYRCDIWSHVLLWTYMWQIWHMELNIAIRVAITHTQKRWSYAQITERIKNLRMNK